MYMPAGHGQLWLLVSRLGVGECQLLGQFNHGPTVATACIEIGWPVFLSLW